MAVQINVAANQAALTASIQAGVQAYNQKFAQNNQVNLSVNQRAFSQPLGRMTGDVKDFEAALAASNARVIAFGASTAVLGGVIRSFKELANVTIDVEKNLADINRVFGLTTGQLQKFSTDLFSVGKQTASSFDDASKAALEFSRQGLKAEEVLIRTKDALTLARVAGISTANSVDALTSTINGFSATGITTTQILNKLVAVEQDFAVGAGDLAEALSRTGQAAQEAGVSLDQLNALVTSAQQSTARGGAVIGNALKTIFTRLQRTDTLDQLEAFNIAVRDVQGNTLPAVTVLQNFAGAYKNLGDAQRAQLSEQVAGVYQVNILKAIVGDLNKSQGVYAGALQRGASATNEAEVATAKLNQTLDALLKQTATSTQQLANNIGKVTFEPLARYGTEQLKSLVESMNEILQGEGVGSTFANGLLKGIRNVVAGPGAIAAFFTLFKLIQNSFTYLAQALPQIAGITTETQNRKNIEQSILQIMQQQGPVSQALAGSMGNQAAQAQLLLQLARQQTAEYQMQSTLAKQLATQLAGQGVRVKGSGGLQVTRAGGYIPNATRMAEAVGAQAGGYAPGKVVKSPVGGVMNTAEDVKYVPGFAQPFINPPAGSKAGRAHRQNAISRTGVDPYMNSGFIPNFAKGFDLGARGKEFEKLINFYLIKEKTSAGSDLLDFNLPSNALTKASLNDKNKISLNPLSVYGDAKIKSTKETKRDLIKKLVGSLDSNVYAKLITRANKIKSDTINLNDFLLDKPSLISSKSSVTNDNLNASIEAQLGPDVIENLQRLLKNNKNTNRLTEDSWYKKLKLNFIDDFITIPDFSNSGFIPNFAIPMEAGRIPWFKKYSTLLKNTSGDKDVFRQKDFPTFGNGLDHFYATNGNNDMVGSLYEKFILSAMNIARNSSVFKTTEELGLKKFPVTDLGNTAAFDLGEDMGPEGLIGIQAKAGSKNNQTSGGGVNKTLTSNIERFGAQNPSRIKDLKKAVLIYNDPRYHDPTGKNPAGFLSPFEQTISGIVKSNYSSVDEALKPKLTKVTDDLLSYYEKNKNTKNAKSLFDGFIPNFAMGDKMRKNMVKNNLRPILFDLANNTYGYSGQDGKEYLYHKDIYNNKLKTKGANVNDYDFAELHNLVRGFIYPTGQITWDYSDKQQEALKDSNIKTKVLAKLNTAKLKLATEKPKVLTRFQELKMRLAAQGEASDYARGFIPNFAGKYITTKFFRAQRGQELFPKKGTGTNLAGTNLRREDGQKILKGSEYFNKLMDNIAVSTIGPNAYVPNASAIDGKIFSNKEETAENFAKIAALNLSGGGAETSFGLTKGMETFANAFGNARKVQNPDLVYSGKLSGKVRTTKYDNLGKVLGRFWSRSPETKAAWEYLENLVVSGKYESEDKEKIRSQTAILTKDYAAFMEKNGYVATIVQMDNDSDNDFRRRAERVERGVDIAALRDDLFGVSEVENLTTKNYKSKGVNYGEYKLNKTKYDKIGRWKYDNLTKKMFLQNKGFIPNFGLSEGFIPNFAYKQAVMGLEESMSGEKAVFDNKPFPHIRNKSQPTFSSAISDHGGLSNALSDSMRGQKDAGLMNRGFVPNFATVKSQDAFGVSSKVLPDVDRRAFVEMNQALKKLTQDLTLTTKEQNALKFQIMQNARVLQVNTGSANIVTLANTALRKSITDNATAQALLAQKTRDQAAAAAVAATAATVSAAASVAASKATAAAAAAAATQAKKTRRQDLKNLSSEQREQRIKQELANDPKTAARYQKRFGPEGGLLEERIGGAIGGLAGRRTGTRINQSIKGLTGVGFQLAAPMIGGMLEQIVSRGRGREDMSVSERFASSAPSSILTGLSTGAFVGTALGGPGIGTAIGAIVGLGQAALSAQDSVSDLANAAESYRGKSTQTTEGAKSYIDQLSQIGNIKDESLLNQATYKLSETFQKLSESSPELAREFSAAAGDVGKMQEAVQKFTKEASLISGIKSLSSSYKKQERPFVELIATRVNELKKKGYDVNESTAKIEKVTEANLQTSFVQFQGFFDMLKQSGLNENQTKSFATDYQKELQAGVTSETALTNIGLKNGMTTKVAEEFAVLGDKRIQEMGTEGTFFIDNMGQITQKYFDKTKQNFKTAVDQSKAIQFNSREMLLNLRKGIDDYIFNASMQIQEKEFDSARLDVLDTAVGEFIDKITSPLEVAGRQAQAKLRQTAMSQENERTRLSSDVINTSGKQIFERLGGGDAKVIEDTLKPILANLQNPETQQQALEDLIKKTSSTEAAKNAGFKGDPEKIAEFNAQLIQQLKSTVSLSAKQKQQLTLVELEIKMSQRRAASTQALIELEGQLINRELERNKILNASSAERQIKTAREKANSEKVGFGFALSPSQINDKKAAIDQNALDSTQLTSREAVFAPGEDFLKKQLSAIQQNLENVKQTQLDNFPKNSDSELYNKASDASSRLSTVNITEFKDIDSYAEKLKEVRNIIKDVVLGNQDVNNAMVAQLGIIDKLKNDQKVEQQTLKANLSVSEQTAKQLGEANKLYNDRLRIVLETTNEEQNFRNSLEIDSQRIDAFISRDANFYGLGVTGKANLEIQKNNENLGISQQQTRLNSLTKARGSLNEFAMYRGGIENLIGPLTYNQNTAKNAISKINPKINNLTDAERVANELETARKMLNPRSDEAKKLADFEYQIRQTLQDNTSELDKQQKLQEILNGKVRQEAEDRQSIRMGFKEGFDQIQTDADTGLNRLAKDTPILFRDGMVSAIKATIREADNLESALMGIASNFLDTISTQLMNTGVSKIISGSGLGSLFGEQTGGYIRAQSGMYISGTGSGDKYPAMLENGEYVLNRRAVMAMGGPAALDTLNFSAAPRFASGGTFKKEFNDISSMEANMTEMGLENSPYYNELNDTAKQKAAEDRAKKLEAKKQKAAMIGSLVAAVATIAIGAGLSNMASNAKATKAEALAAKAQGGPENLTKSEIKAYEGFQKSGMINSYGEYAGPQAQTGFRSLTSKPFYSSNIYGPNPYAPAFKNNGRQTGGLIGSRLSDTIPGYMEGGLYDSPMVKRYGTGMQSGGSPISSAGNSNSTVNNNTSANNSFNFNTSVQRDGSLKIGSNTTSYEQQDIELSKNLNNKIYAAVGEVIRKEKQFGGSLAGVRNQ